MKKQKYISKIKNILYLICIFNILSLIFNISAVMAQTATPKPTVKETVNEKLNSQINTLKDKIASRVTELNLVEKRGVIGEVTETTTNKITLKDLQGKTKLVDIDEITKFSSSASRTFGLSDLTKGTKVTVLGLYNKQTKRILARFITTSVDPVFLTGGISEIDPQNSTVTLTSADQKKTKIDIGNTTKLSSRGEDNTLTKIVFSRLALSDRISVVGFPDKTAPGLIVASRVIVLSGLPKDPKIIISEPSPVLSPAVSPTSAPNTRRVSPTIRR